MNKILKSAFLQLTLVYSVLILIISLGFISKYTLYFNLLALIIAVFGISIISKQETPNPKNNRKA